ncbi:hypothetical protein ACFSL4_12220 [Streptomyces caeni]|uniref:Uncharacterized protein n=1 Tax=Streptomyces caeni TaxID=2307231 RepID=A0ABW4INN7_9ACTN
MTRRSVSWASGSGRRTAAALMLVWAATCGTADAAGSAAATAVSWDQGKAAVAVAAQARAQELAAWEAQRASAYEVAVRRAVLEAELAAARARAERARGGGSATRGTGSSPAGQGAAGGTAGTDWGATIAKELSTPHPRPESTPQVDPEHQQLVEDSFTRPVAEFTGMP